MLTKFKTACTFAATVFTSVTDFIAAHPRTTLVVSVAAVVLALAV